MVKRDLFGSKTPSSNREWESPFGSDSSSVDLGFSQMGTPIQPEKIYPLTSFAKNNDGNSHPEIQKYISDVIGQGDEDKQKFVNYQYDHNLFSPFTQDDSSLSREPLENIPPFSLQRKDTYTDWVKENRKDYSFVYGENNVKYR